MQRQLILVLVVELAAGFDRLDANGVITAQELVMGYRITFSGGGGTATGMVDAVHQ